MLWVSMFVCIYLSVKRAKAYDITLMKAIPITMLLILYGCAGARLLNILENPGEAANGGMSVFGSIFLVPIAMAITALIFRIKIGKCIDFVAMYVPLIIAFMRVGCMVSGCCGGIVVTIGTLEFVPPVQLIECLFDLCIFGILFWQEKKNQIIAQGEQYPKFLIMYSVIRFILEIFRDTQKNILGLSSGQWFSIIALIIGTVVFVVLRIAIKRKGVTKK